MGQQFVVELLFRGRADTAKAATAEVKREISGVTAATRQATEATARQTAVLTANSQATQLAAGSVGNLTAQFNDIGMMMMAGQNPLQLAIQQGSQISQVLGPMGARGAVAALSAGILGMLNPVSLLTMGIIAAGAAFTQWLTSADEEALTLKDAISDLSDATDTYKAALDRALTPMWKLRQEFGDQAEAVRALYAAQANLARLDAMISMERSVAAVGTEFQGLIDRLAMIDSVINQGALGDDVTLVLRRQLQLLNEETGLTEQQARAAAAALADVTAAQAKGPDEMRAALARALEVLMSLGDESGRLPDHIAIAAKEIATAAVKANELAGPLAEAEEHVAGIASIDMAAGISAAAGEALLLADRLGIALSTARAITGAAAEAQAANGPRLGFGGLGAAGTGSFANNPDVPLSFGPNPGVAPTRNNGYEPPAAPRSSGGGGGASKAMNTDLREAERLFEATRTAAEKYDAELARINELYESGHISAETQARAIEMIGEKYLEAGSDAKFFKEITDDIKDAILDLAVEGSASFDQIAAAIARAAWQATLFGEGPLAGLFGTSGGGGLLSGIFGMFGAAPAHADGGLITGPGTGRSDSILARVSNGEYIVNAEATARHRGLLEAINGGAGLPGFATGGLVGALPAPILVGSQSQGTEAPLVRIALSLTDDLDARIDQRSARVAVDVTGESLRQFTRKGLPGEVQKIVGDRRVRN